MFLTIITSVLQLLQDRVLSGEFSNWPVRINITTRDLVHRDLTFIKPVTLAYSARWRHIDKTGPIFPASHADVTSVTDSVLGQHVPKSKRGYSFRSDLCRKNDHETENLRQRYKV